jgi:hypothetical protein
MACEGNSARLTQKRFQLVPLVVTAAFLAPRFVTVNWAYRSIIAGDVDFEGVSLGTFA